MEDTGNGGWKFLLMFRGSKPTSKLKALSGLDFDRFQGRWLVAYYVPQPFRKRLTSLSTEYTRNEDGTIKIAGHGYDRKKKKWDSEEATAKFKETENTGWFVVNTARPWDENRKIIYLNDDYTQTIVVGLTMRTIWIMYRDPNITKKDLDALIARADGFGIKTSKLVRVDQTRSLESS